MGKWVNEIGASGLREIGSSEDRVIGSFGLG